MIMMKITNEFLCYLLLLEWNQFDTLGWVFSAPFKIEVLLFDNFPLNSHYETPLILKPRLNIILGWWGEVRQDRMLGWGSMGLILINSFFHINAYENFRFFSYPIISFLPPSFYISFVFPLLLFLPPSFYSNCRKKSRHKWHRANRYERARLGDYLYSVFCILYCSRCLRGWCLMDEEANEFGWRHTGMMIITEHHPMPALCNAKYIISLQSSGCVRWQNPTKPGASCRSGGVL